MTNRVLRWLSALSLVMLTLEVVWIVADPRPHFVALSSPIDPSEPRRAFITNLILPLPTVAVCLLSGLSTLVVSSQRRQWGWCAGAVICFAVFLYGSTPSILVYAFAWIGGWIEPGHRPFQGGHPVDVYHLYQFVLVVAPLAILALVYAWSQRPPAPAAS